MEMAKGDAMSALDRHRLYDRLRQEVSKVSTDMESAKKALTALEKAIRRHEVQALLEEGNRRK